MSKSKRKFQSDEKKLQILRKKKIMELGVP